ncbi:MAG: glycosyltransferase [Chloroflexota bacterium]
MEEATKRPLRICYFGTYRTGYSRNQIMLAGLHEAGAEVLECHATLWRGVEDRVQQASGGWRSLGFIKRIVQAYWQLFRAHNKTADYDVMLIGYPGPFDAYLGRLLSWWRGKPMVLDHYMSLYLIADERGLVAKSPFTGWLIRTLEGIGLKLNDLLISDTAEYIDYHCQTYGLTPNRFQLVPAGADGRFFYPRPHLKPPTDCFRVLYYGTYIPNHGVPTMVEAARLLRDEADIVFDFYGEGPERPFAQQLAEEAPNITFHGWIEKENLPTVMAQSHLCFGVFGTTPQSQMTVQNKIWEAAAMARPILSGDSVTVRAALKHGEEIFLVPRNDSAAVAEAILRLQDDAALRERLGEGANGRFRQGNTIRQLGEKTIAALEVALEDSDPQIAAQKHITRDPS